jgi:hypothetical protein
VKLKDLSAGDFIWCDCCKNKQCLLVTSFKDEYKMSFIILSKVGQYPCYWESSYCFDLSVEVPSFKKLE